MDERDGGLSSKTSIRMREMMISRNGSLLFPEGRRAILPPGSAALRAKVGIEDRLACSECTWRFCKSDNIWVA